MKIINQLDVSYPFRLITNQSKLLPLGKLLKKLFAILKRSILTSKKQKKETKLLFLLLLKFNNYQTNKKNNRRLFKISKKQTPKLSSQDCISNSLDYPTIRSKRESRKLRERITMPLRRIYSKQSRLLNEPNME